MSDVEPDIDETDALRDDFSRLFLAGFDDPVYRWVVRLFILGSAAHLWLRNAWSLEWVVADLVYLAGLALLAWRGPLLGWCLSAWGALEPLLFHRDYLTQSVVLLAVAVAGAAATAIRARRRRRNATSEAHDPDRRRRSPELAGFLRAVQWVAILTYACAFLHKLNADFLAGSESCALYGLDQLLAYWRVDAETGSSFAPWVPLGLLAAEGGIAALHLARLRRLAWQVAVAFHIPLTLTMAPAFAFVMASTHAAFLRKRDLDRIGDVLDEHTTGIGFAGAAAAAVSAGAHGAWPGASMVLKEALLWSTLAGLFVAFPPWVAGARERAGPLPGATSTLDIQTAIPGAVGVLFALNCLSPYLGLQYQHAGAMVSNLRIDRGCWNSLVVPESVRLTDPYIRVDDVYFGRPGAIPEYEEIVRTKLWSPPEVRQMRRNWCRPEVRPFYLTGTHRGARFEIEDLCAGEPLPFGEWRVAGVAVFGDFLRFQKNLERQCHQSCIH